uniref:Uncharacterized protein n=1 Tax=Meloidogyne floridensis TaxID=298350 RepID=A0A915NDL9_9BILA
MKDCNIELSVRIFRHLGDVAMVWALEELLIIGGNLLKIFPQKIPPFKIKEDQQVLSGHIASLLGDFDLADKLFCDSSEPKLALEAYLA